MSIISTSDVPSNANDQIAHAARVIGRSDHRRRVFEAIHSGKKKIKTVTEISDKINLPRKRVLEEGKKLTNNKIVEQIRTKDGLAYVKNPFYGQNKRKIISLAKNRKKLKDFPTKISQQTKFIFQVQAQRKIRYRHISINEIDSFENVRKIKTSQTPPAFSENKLKEAIQRIIGEKGQFTDWGGEKNDLYTTRLILNNKRIPTAIAFKGKGTSGKLTPNKMGKNGDQIPRLFFSAAQIFLIFYQGQIDESITAQMETQAIHKALGSSNQIYYGVVDETDIQLLYNAYPECFK